MNKIMYYCTDNLKLLANKYPYLWKKIKFKNKNKWLREDDGPTYNQLVSVAKIIKVPFGYLCLNVKDFELRLTKSRKIETIKERTEHPTQKRLDITKEFVINSSREGDIVLDCFCGSGTTGVAAIELNRNYLLNDFDEKWVKLSEERIKNAQYGLILK